MWNHDAIWAVRSSFDLDHWFQWMERHRGSRVGHDKDYWHQEPRLRYMRYRDSIAAIESRMNLDHWFNSLSDFSRSGLEGVKNSHGEVVKSREDLGRRIWGNYEGPIAFRYGEAARQIWQSWSVGSRGHVAIDHHVADWKVKGTRFDLSHQIEVWS